MASGNGVVKWIVTALTLTLAACGPDPRSPPLPSSPATAPADHESFLKRHWARPLAPQGAPPAGFGPQEASLAPAACGQCHAQQLEDWQTALHSKAMGPGLVGQLQEMDAGAVDDHQACLRCHAPLAEQQADLQQTLAASGAVSARADGAAFTHGLTCAGCHARQNQRFGPARRDGSSPAAGSALPHAGWQVSAAFEDSRFCAACHQFEPDGFALNGKLLENTAEEWKASPSAAQGKTCQSCHMPERRHLWRGVHDPEMMRAAVSVEAQPPRTEQGMIRAALRIHNTGTGHYFPTYVTPRVVAEIFQESAAGRMIEGTLAQHVIQRQVALDLSREIADTRLAPGGEAVLDYRRAPAPGSVRLVYRLRVEPDQFYTELYESLLVSDAGRGAKMIREALARSRASHFAFYEERRALQ